MPGNCSEKPVPSVAKLANAPLESARSNTGWQHSLHPNDPVRMVAEEVRPVARQICFLPISHLTDHLHNALTLTILHG